MNRREMSFLVGGAATSFVAAFLLFQVTSAPNGGSGAQSPTHVSNTEVGNWSAAGTEIAQRIEPLHAELDAPRANAESTGTGTPDLDAVQASYARLQDATQKLRDFQNDRLLAAGFSQERINFIRERSAAVEAQRAQAQRDARSKGLAEDPDMTAAYTYNKDLDLRYEIGDDEYEKYRSALGRPTGVRVADVPPDSALGIAGLRPGDEIVGYGGKRVFNIGELNSLAAKGTPGELVAVDVRSDGMVRQVLLPRGRLDIPGPYVAPAMPLPVLR